MSALQVIARDEESGEEVSASVDIEVLQRGQAGEHETWEHALKWTYKHTYYKHEAVTLHKVLFDTITDIVTPAPPAAIIPSNEDCETFLSF